MHDRIRDVLPMGGEIDVRQVYGIEGYVTRGILFAAAHDGDLLVRLDSESRMEALEMSGATTWSPDDGVESYVIIPSYHLNSDETLRFWVNRALDYAEALGLEGEEDEMDEGFEEYEAPRSGFAESPMEANGASHDEDDEMEGEEVRLPPPARRPAAPKPRAADPAAPSAASDSSAVKPATTPKPPAAAPRKKSAAPAKKKAATKTKAPAKASAPKKAAKVRSKSSGKKKAAPQRKAAPGKKPSAKKAVKRVASTVKGAPKKQAVAKKKAVARKEQVAGKKSAARKPAKKAAPKKKSSKRR